MPLAVLAPDDLLTRAERHTGVMIAFFLPDELAAQLAAQVADVLPSDVDGENARDLHITLAYLGNSADYTEDAQQRLQQCVTSFVEQINTPLYAQLSGVGRFTSVPDGAKTVLYASVDWPALEDWRQALMAALNSAGFIADGTHGFTPHVTLAYLDAAMPTPDITVSQACINFPALTLAVAEARFDYRFPHPNPDPPTPTSVSLTSDQEPQENRLMGRTPSAALVSDATTQSADSAALERAVWATAEQNDLPDSSFAVIEDGGKKDEEGKTTPRSLRHLPYKDADGKIDLPHLRNALARLPQSSLSDEDKAKAQKVLDAAAKEAGVGDENKDGKKDDGKRAANASATPGAELAGTLYAPFVRRDDGKWEVEGVLTSEAIDSYGTIFDYESAKRAVADWAGNVREQHDIHKAVGRRVEYECDDANRQVRLRVRVSRGAPDTWAKVLDGTLTGFSIGAYDAQRETRSVNGRSVPFYKDYKYGEVSLVDAPSNPDAANSGLVICRAADANGVREWNDAVLEQFEVAPAESPASEAPVAPIAPIAPIATPAAVAPVAPVEPEQAGVIESRAAAPAVAPSPSATQAQEALAALEGVMGPMSDEQKAQISRAAALMRGVAGAPADPTATPVVASASTPEAASADAPVPAAVTAADTTRYLGQDSEALPYPIHEDGAANTDKAMLDETGHAHDAHDHAHATSYGGFHEHDHSHTHQDGTAHSHPHMHNHVHHEHYGDAGHSHAHTHVHDHSHEYRKAAPDLSTTQEAYPDGREAATTLAPSAAPDLTRAASHGAFTGKHAHAHAAFGSQGEDESHEHEHSHDGDADHHHSHEAEGGDGGDGERAAAASELTAVVTPAVSEMPAIPESTLERAGQRISSSTRAALHQAALQILRTCDCPTCQDAIALYDPDDDGDDDLDGPAGGDDPDADGPMRSVGSREAARLMRLQQVKLTRATRKSVATEVERQLTPLVQQFRAIAARLTTVQASSDDANSVPSSDNVKSQLDELRASMGAVQGLVERIAAQPASGGPILRAVDKTLGMYTSPQALDASAAPAIPAELTPEQLIAAVRQLQRSGALSQQDSQVSAAATILQQQMRSGR